MNQNKIYYYLSSNGENPIQEFLDSLEKSQKAKVFRIFEAIEIYGLEAIISHVKKLMGSPLWEIRILGKNNIRLFYAVIEKDSVLILHGFIKKTQKTLQREISTAMHNYKDWKLRNL